MIVNTNQTVRKISAQLTDVEIALAKAYIQGAVHSHCNNCADKELSARILFGGDNRDWGNTPLQCIYKYYKEKKRSQHPADDAAKDVGWLLKSVLDEDSREFECVGEDTGKKYKLSK